MENSILISIKKLIGISEEDKSFDTDIIIHINSALMNLSQIGVGPPSGFIVSDENDEWSDFTLDATNIESVKTYVYIKVKLVFDPPASSSLIDAYERQAKELEWRISSSVDYSKIIVENTKDIITEPLTIEENGIYTADEGKAYSPVTVSVPQTFIEPLTATENGTYTAESGKAFNPVVVNIPEQIKTLDSVPDTKITDIIVVSGDYYLWKEGA